MDLDGSSICAELVVGVTVALGDGTGITTASEVNARKDTVPVSFGKSLFAPKLSFSKAWELTL